MRVEGRANLGYRRYRELVLVSGKNRLLRLWAGAGLVAVGVLLANEAAGAVLLIGVAIALPLWFDFSLRRTWRRLAGGASALDIGYELTDEGLRISTAQTSTLHRWESLRPLNQTARYWLFQWLPGRRALAVPKHAFDADAQLAVAGIIAGLR